MSAPAGPAVLPEDACELDHRDRPWRLAVGYGLLSTRLVSASAPEAALDEQVATVRFTRRSSPTSVWGMGLGLVTRGSLSMPSEAWSLGPGALIDGQWMRVLRDGAAGGPWVTGSLSGSVAVARASGAAEGWLTSVDLRGTLVAGTVLFGRIAPYAALSAFGGPVFYPGSIMRFAGDAYHLRPAVGLVGMLPGHLDLTLDVAPVLERGANVTIGYAL